VWRPCRKVQHVDDDDDDDDDEGYRLPRDGGMGQAVPARDHARGGCEGKTRAADMCQRPMRRMATTQFAPVLLSSGCPGAESTCINAAATTGRTTLLRAYPNPYLERLCISSPFRSADSSRPRLRICAADVVAVVERGIFPTKSSREIARTRLVTPKSPMQARETSRFSRENRKRVSAASPATRLRDPYQDPAIWETTKTSNDQIGGRVAR